MAITKYGTLDLDPAHNLTPIPIYSCPEIKIDLDRMGASVSDIYISINGGTSISSSGLSPSVTPEFFELFPIDFLETVKGEYESYRLATITSFSVPNDTSTHEYNYTNGSANVNVYMIRNYLYGTRIFQYNVMPGTGVSSEILFPLYFMEYNPSQYTNPPIQMALLLRVGVTGSASNLQTWKNSGGPDQVYVAVLMSVKRDQSTLKINDYSRAAIKPSFASNRGDIATVASLMGGYDTKFSSMGVEVIPAWPGSSSGTGGAGGDFDDSTDSVAIPALPTVAPAVSSNFITIYHPTISELEQIGTVLWSSTISAAIKNLFSDPINAIISLHQTPFPLMTAAQKTEWFVGLVGTGVSMNKVTKQYLQYDFGSVDITEYWGNALDYSPYTKAQIYLPYIGIKDLDIDDIMASSVRVVYHVDILTGTCVAYIIVTKKDKRSPLYDTPTVLYQFTGNCNLMIPYTGADYSALVQNIITLAGAAVAAGATGGLSTQVTGADAIMGASTAMQSVGAVSGSKPTLLKGGQTGGVAGALGVQNCAIYLTRPNQSLAEDYASERGYPSNITATLGDLKGFTAVESCHVGISGATDEELAEIESFLKSGVIL